MLQDGTDPDRVELVIFGCGGILIDSAIVACRLTGEELTRLGHPVASGEVIADIERGWGRAVPPGCFGRVRRRIHEAHANELRALPGAADLLGRLRGPVRVASSSHPEKPRLGPETVGLHDGFAPNLVSASFVAPGKPAPDVSIHAAGMRVFGFTGKGHSSPDHGRRLGGGRGRTRRSAPMRPEP